MKSLVLTIALIAFGAFAYGQRHNYQFGYRQAQDSLLNRTIAYKSSSVFKGQNMEIVYPGKGQRGRNITAIVITDQYINGKGGFAKLLTGGVGFNYTKIRLESKRNQGFNFIVDIYGR